MKMKAILLTPENSPRIRDAIENLVALRGRDYTRCVLLFVSGTAIFENLIKAGFHDQVLLEQLSSFISQATTELGSALFPNSSAPWSSTDLIRDANMINSLAEQDGDALRQRQGK